MQISLLGENFALFKSIISLVLTPFPSLQKYNRTVVSLYNNRAFSPTHLTAGRMFDEKLLKIPDKGFLHTFIVVGKALSQRYNGTEQTKALI